MTPPSSLLSSSHSPQSRTLHTHGGGWILNGCPSCLATMLLCFHFGDFVTQRSRCQCHRANPRNPSPSPHHGPLANPATPTPTSSTPTTCHGLSSKTFQCVSLRQQFSARGAATPSPSRGHLAMSGYPSGCHNGEKGMGT